MVQQTGGGLLRGARARLVSCGTRLLCLLRRSDRLPQCRGGIGRDALHQSGSLSGRVRHALLGPAVELTALLPTTLFSTALLRAEVLADGPEVVDIGGRRELFVDHFLIDRLDGARLKLHAPLAREKVFTMDRPWEGLYSGYFNHLSC